MRTVVPVSPGEVPDEGYLKRHGLTKYRLANDIGVSPLRDVADPAVKAQLQANTDQALELGVFGVPTVEVDGKLFWGFDALPMLAAYLRQDTWFDGPDWPAAGAAGVGLQRVSLRVV
ncbi:MAG: DsbA family protein [Rhodoferax sp.]|nr:DsbA family protein [Rhodoferax sp.]